MIIKGGHKKAIEITHWLQTEYDLDWPNDYTWYMKPFSNNTEIIFNFKDSSVATIVALKYAHERN
jgi:hypothetical protein